MAKHQILIIGGGTAGLTVASRLLLKNKNLDIGLIEPSETHYYQPAWTLVGGGTFKLEDTAKPEARYMPKGVTWIKDRVTSLDPDNNAVHMAESGSISYDYLVVAPGIQIDWHKIEGLKESLGKGGVCSNYDYNQCSYTWEILKNFKGGTALFTNPNTPIKCGGAPQKIMYLVADYLRKHDLLKQSDIRFTSAGGVIFGVQPYKAALEKVVERYGIQTDWHHNLKAIRGDRNEAVYDILKDGKPVDEVTLKYDMIHVTPPMSAPDFIKYSPLADEGMDVSICLTEEDETKPGLLANTDGWLELDKHTLQNPTYPNVFGLGDAAGLPCAKTGAAVRKQAPVLVENLLSAMTGATLRAQYDGYGSCPLITGYGKLILAEFNYENKSTPTFPFDQSKERWSMFILKKYLLPWMYWNRMLQGKA